MRLHDVIIREIRDARQDPSDGPWVHQLEVWTDTGRKDLLLQEVKGVVSVYVTDYQESSTNSARYTIYVDPRFDLDTIKSEIFQICTIGVIIRGDDDDV